MQPGGIVTLPFLNCAPIRSRAVVQRREFLGGYLGRFAQHGLGQILIDRFAAGQGSQLLKPDQAREDETDIGKRRGEGNHDRILCRYSLKNHE